MLFRGELSISGCDSPSCALPSLAGARGGLAIATKKMFAPRKQGIKGGVAALCESSLFLLLLLLPRTCKSPGGEMRGGRLLRTSSRDRAKFYSVLVDDDERERYLYARFDYLNAFVSIGLATK